MSISILTTIYNGSRYIERLAANYSMLSQTFDGPMEFIVVNDGSTDCSYEKLLKEKTKHNLKDLIILNSNKVGRGAALNLAAKNSSMEICAIQDADDLSCSKRLTRIEQLSRTHPDAVLFSTGGKIIEEKKLSSTWATLMTSEIPEIKREKEFTETDIFRKNFLIHSSCAFRRAAWEKSQGYSENLPCCIDLDFYFKILRFGKGIYAHDEHIIFSKNEGSFYRQLDPSIYRKTLFRVLHEARFTSKIDTADLVTGYIRAIKYTM